MPGELGYDTGPFVNAAVFCETVIDGKDDVLSLVRIIDRMTINAQGAEAPDDLPPGAVKANLVVMLRAGKALGGQKLRIDLETPDGNQMRSPEQTIHFTAGEAGGANVIAPMTIPVSSAGLFWANVYINDRLMSRVPLEIRYSVTRSP